MSIRDCELHLKHIFSCTLCHAATNTTTAARLFSCYTAISTNFSFIPSQAAGNCQGSRNAHKCLFTAQMRGYSGSANIPRNGVPLYCMGAVKRQSIIVKFKDEKRVLVKSPTSAGRFLPSKYCSSISLWSYFSSAILHSPRMCVGKVEFL